MSENEKTVTKNAFVLAALFNHIKLGGVEGSYSYTPYEEVKTVLQGSNCARFMTNDEEKKITFAVDENDSENFSPFGLIKASGLFMSVETAQNILDNNKNKYCYSINGVILNVDFSEDDQVTTKCNTYDNFGKASFYDVVLGASKEYDKLVKIATVGVKEKLDHFNI